MATSNTIEPESHDSVPTPTEGALGRAWAWVFGVNDLPGAFEGKAYEQLFESENLSKLDLDTLEIAVTDAQQSLDAHLAVFTELSNKAVQLIQINGLVVTLLLAVFADIDGANTYLNVLTGAGVLLFVFSFITAFIAYFTRKARLGISDEDIRYVYTTGEEFEDKRIYPVWKLDALADSIEFARLNFTSRLRAVNASMISFACGVLALCLGVFLQLMGLIG